MEVHRPAPGEELNPGAPTEPRQAASVIVLRGGGAALEVLLLRRNPAARFMGGAWVFPGGATDAGEDHRSAAVREAAEEAGLVLEPAVLVPFSRWITPAQLTIRFDTHFFLAPAPREQEPRADGSEMVDLGWRAPADALDAHRRGELQLVFPTIKHLERIATFGTADELLDWATGREVVAVEPRVVEVTGEAGRIVLPGEPGYGDDAAREP
jgi:8-oxo-dGTP pyrophosphatase MutT (NUDIX family)